MYYNQLIYKYFDFDAKCDKGINEHFVTNMKRDKSNECRWNFNETV